MVEGDVRESAKDREAGQVQNSGSALSPPREMSSNGRAGGMGRRRSQTQAAADQGSPLGSGDGPCRASCSASAARG